MSTAITFNGASYVIPAIADASWGTIVGNYLIAISTGCLQKTGGAFTLSAADIDFGGTYGLKSVYFKSRTTNIAAAGVVMLAKTDVIGWRNNANSADIDLGINSSDQLTFNSVIISDVASSQVFTNKLFSDSTCDFANVSDNTKLLKFSLGGATTGKTMTIASAHTNDRTLTLPDTTDTVMALAFAQSPTNKTFDSTSVMTGVTMASWTPDGTHTLTAPTITDTLAVLASQQTFTNKLFSDSTAKFANVSDATKLLLFSLGGATTAKKMTIVSSHTNDRTLTLPDVTDTLAGITAAQTLTNKTHTAPQITGGSFVNFLAQAAARFNDASTDYVSIASPSTVSTYSLLLPAAQGGASTVLANDGAGNLSWAAQASATLTSQDTDIGNTSNVRTATNTALLGDIVANTNTATVTMTIATPGVVTWTGHPFSTGDKTYFTTSGALPTGISASTTYWVIKTSANTYNIATSLANAVAGTAIATTGSQSGTHTGFSGGLTLISGVKGFVTNTTPTAGYVGELITQSRVKSSAASLTSGSPLNVTATALTLTPGVWDITGAVGFLTATSTSVTEWIGAISLTSATLPASGTNCVPTGGEVLIGQDTSANIPGNNDNFVTILPPCRAVISAATTYFLVAQASFSASTLTVFGSITGRRIA